jgi:Flp pilus assembly pilin Flp
MRAMWRFLVLDESGATALEYAVLVVLVAVAVTAAVAALGLITTGHYQAAGKAFPK